MKISCLIWLIIPVFLLSVHSSNGQPSAVVSDTNAQPLISYGQLILLGTPNMKMEFNRRAEPNGIKPNPTFITNNHSKPEPEYVWHNGQYIMFDGSQNPPAGITDNHSLLALSTDGHGKKDTTTHTITYATNKTETKVAHYESDKNLDMFQIGRKDQNDFIVDISTISRFACRIVAERDVPENMRIYAAGFNEKNDLFLGEDAIKIPMPNDQYDGLVTFGVYILSPYDDEIAPSDTASSNSKKYELEKDDLLARWKEVSVNGQIYTKRKKREPGQFGELVPSADGQTNKLEDGTLIDICGAVLLWRSAEGIKLSPTSEQIGKLNMVQHAQCQVYKNCGHIQSQHEKADVGRQCPLCKISSSAMVKLNLGNEPAFHMGSDEFDHAFMPCGHMASERTVKFWSKVLIPSKSYDDDYAKICPFCNTSLDNEKPFIKLFFD